MRVGIDLKGGRVIVGEEAGKQAGRQTNNISKERRDDNWKYLTKTKVYSRMVAVTVDSAGLYRRRKVEASDGAIRSVTNHVILLGEVTHGSSRGTSEHFSGAGCAYQSTP